MYLLYAGPNKAKAIFFESVLFTIDQSKTLLAVSNGYELLNFLQQVKKGEAYPAIIILEMEMPKLNGRETLEMLKCDDLYRLIPVFILYVNISEDEASFCTKLGADCLQQPTSSILWKRMVHQLCDSCNS